MQNSINWPFKRTYTERGFTLEELGERAKINPTYLSLFARGRFNLQPEQVERLALILNVPVERISGSE